MRALLLGLSGLLLGLASCATVSPPDPLAATAAAVSAAGAAITAESRRVEDELRRDLRERRARCAGGDRACLALARDEALAGVTPRVARLIEATAVQHAAAAAVEEADRCRRAGGSCDAYQAAALAAVAELAPLAAELAGGAR